MKDSKIDWTGSTWNAVTGCTEISPGCENCYAKVIAERNAGGVAFPNGFAITLRPHKMEDPKRWRDGRLVFVNSMSDLFHEDIPDGYIARQWQVMVDAPQHSYQILTKRPGRALRLARQLEWPRHIWLGITVESQDYINRLAVLRKIPAAVRFVSAEPLLGPLDLSDHLAELDWIITGGESGSGRRPADPDWFRQIRDACARAGVAFFHKQGNHHVSGRDRALDGEIVEQYPRPHPTTGRHGTAPNGIYLAGDADSELRAHDAAIAAGVVAAIAPKISDVTPDPQGSLL